MFLMQFFVFILLTANAFSSTFFFTKDDIGSESISIAAYKYNTDNIPLLSSNLFQQHL